MEIEIWYQLHRDPRGPACEMGFLNVKEGTTFRQLQEAVGASTISLARSSGFEVMSSDTLVYSVGGLEAYFPAHLKPGEFSERVKTYNFRTYFSAQNQD